MTPATARAAALVAYGQPLEFVDVRIPELERGAILVKTSMASICATDVHLMEGPSGVVTDRSMFPRIPGHEVMGRVARLGEGVVADSLGQPLSEGDRIVWTNSFCGQCPECVVEHTPTLCRNAEYYSTRPCTEFPYLTGAFSEYCYVFPRSGCVKVPDDVSDAVASASSCALRTMIHAFDRLGALDQRQTVVVQGCGALGLFSLSKAICSGAGQVIVVGGPADRLAIADRWGAARTLDIGEVPDPRERVALVHDWTDGQGADVVIEVSGVASAFPEGLDMLRRGGRYLVVGPVGREETVMRPGDIVLKQARIIGSVSASADHYFRALEFVRQNADRFPFDDVVSGVYAFEDINLAMDRMTRHEELKAAIRF